MSVKWIKTNVKGVRYYEHPVRKHGIKKDRYYAIRFQHAGKRKEEGLGWASDDWTLEKANQELAALKRAARIGEGETRLSEKRANQKAEKEQKRLAKEQQKLNALTFSQFFEDTYSPHAKDNKSARAYNTEQSLFDHWIKPTIGTTELVNVSPIHLERIKKNMSDAEKSPRTIQYALAVIRQAFNYANRIDIFSGTNPVSKIKAPSFDNKKVRFLTQDEATLLLNVLKLKSPQVYEMSLVSLHCGLRAGEVFSLKWGDIDLKHGIIHAMDTKTGMNRAVHMTKDVKRILEAKKQEKTDLIFPNTKGDKIVQISNTFDRTITEMGLNDGVTDRRQKITFNGLRHTHASWLVMAGIDLYTVKKMLGHSTIKMTERYSHLAPDRLKAATQTFEKGLKTKKKIVEMK